MSDTCTHLDHVQLTELPASSDGCEDCLATGGQWLHLRICLECGKVGCCDSSPSQHARRHAAEAQHPIDALAPARRGVVVVLRRRARHGHSGGSRRDTHPALAARRLKRRRVGASNQCAGAGAIDLCQPVGSLTSPASRKSPPKSPDREGGCATRGVLWALASIGWVGQRVRRQPTGSRWISRVCADMPYKSAKRQERAGRAVWRAASHPAKPRQDPAGRSRLGIQNLDYRAQDLRVSVTRSPPSPGPGCGKARSRRHSTGA